MLLYISNLDQKAEFSIFELQKAREEMDEVDFNLIAAQREVDAEAIRVLKEEKVDLALKLVNLTKAKEK